MTTGTTAPFKGVSAPPESLYEGAIFCDCDGTLFTTKANGQFNENLFKFLIELKKAGHKVVIFSGEHASNEDRVKLFSRKFTGNAAFFEFDDMIITPKDSLDREKVFLVIDDNHTTHNLDAEHQWDPNDPEVIVGIRLALEHPELIAKFKESYDLRVA